MHDDDTLPAGTVGYQRGLLPRDVRPVTITVYGAAATPRCRRTRWIRWCSPSRIVMALQTVVARENNPVDPVVVTVGSIHGGTAGNIIPDEVRLQL